MHEQFQALMTVCCLTEKIIGKNFWKDVTYEISFVGSRMESNQEFQRAESGREGGFTALEIIGHVG